MYLIQTHLNENKQALSEIPRTRDTAQNERPFISTHTHMDVVDFSKPMFQSSRK